MSEEKAKKIEKIAIEGPNSVLKGNRGWYDVAGKNYKIEFPTTTTTAVNIVDKTSRVAQVVKAQEKVTKVAKFLEKAVANGDAKAIERATNSLKTAESALQSARVAAPKGTWVARLDTPHTGANFNHININPDVVNIQRAADQAKFVDPHYRLPEAGAVQVGTGAAKFAKVVNKVNKVAVPLAIAVDVGRTGYALVRDVQRNTSRNTVTTAANIAGGWAGGYGGAATGVALGTSIFPGVGTIIGGIVGGLVGGIGGSAASGALVDAIGDDCDYDMEWRSCKSCEKRFKARVYLGQTKCEKCR